MNSNYQRIKEINEEFSTYIIPNDPKELLKYLIDGDKNATKNFNILRDFVLAQIHIDQHFEHIIIEYNGLTRCNEVNWYTGNNNFPIVNSKGIDKEGTFIDGKYIFTEILKGNKEPYKEILKFIDTYYENDLLSQNPINTVLSNQEIEEQRDLYLKLAAKEGKSEEDVEREIQKIREKNIKLEKTKKAHVNKEKILEEIRQKIENLLSSINKKEQLEKDTNELKSNMYKDIEKEKSGISILKTTYQLFKIKNMPEKDKEKFFSRSPKNKLEKIIQKRYLQTKIRKKENELLGFDIKKEEELKQIEESLAKAKQFCISKLGIREIEDLITIVNSEMSFKEILINVNSAIQYIKEKEKLEQDPGGEYKFCYNRLFQYVEELAEDIKINLELGKKIYSPEFLNNNNFEEICQKIREEMAKGKINTERNPEDGKMIGIEKGYRKEAYNERLQEKHPFIKGGKYGYNEIVNQMHLLGEKFTELQDCQNLEEYIRKSSDFIHEFVELHPYSEGNGRTSRILLNIMMAKKGLVIPSIIETYYERYSSSEYSRAGEEAAKGNKRPMQEYLLKRVRQYNAPDNADSISISKFINHALNAEKICYTDINGSNKNFIINRENADKGESKDARKL